jgi:ATP-dependent Clp protease ATP-binding subunit ClpC
MFERFTDRARRVVVLAQEEARLLDHNYIGTEHLLLGLLREGQGVAAEALEALGVDLAEVRSRVEGMIGRGQHEQSGHIPFTPRAKKVLEMSLREAMNLGHDDIGTEHILLGLAREGQGVAAQVLNDMGAGASRIAGKVTELAGTAGERPAEQQVPIRILGSPAQLREIVSRLDAIDRRLAAIERHLGIGEPPGAAAQE